MNVRSGLKSVMSSTSYVLKYLGYMFACLVMTAPAESVGGQRWLHHGDLELARSSTFTFHPHSRQLGRSVFVSIADIHIDGACRIDIQSQACKQFIYRLLRARVAPDYFPLRRYVLNDAFA